MIEAYLLKKRNIIEYRQKLITSLKAQIQMIDELLVTTSSGFKDVVVQTSVNNKIENLIVRKSEVEDMIVDEGFQLTREQKQLESLWKDLPIEYVSIMRSYYQLGYTWEETSDLLNYSMSTIFRKKSRAVSILDKLYKNQLLD